MYIDCLGLYSILLVGQDELGATNGRKNKSKEEKKYGIGLLSSLFPWKKNFFAKHRMDSQLGQSAHDKWTLNMRNGTSLNRGLTTSLMWWRGRSGGEGGVVDEEVTDDRTFGLIDRLNLPKISSMLPEKLPT